MRSLCCLSLVVLALCGAALGQESWSVSKADAPGDLITAFFTSSSRGFIAGDDGYLASTDDGGQTWNQYPLNTDANINEIYFRNEKNGYLVAGRKMYITRDGGRTWDETRIFRTGEFKNGTPEFLSIRFADKKRGFVVGSILSRDDRVIDSLVVRTVDGGDTWQRVSVPGNKELIHLDLNGSSHGWIVGDDGMIIATTDGGDTWRIQKSGTRLPLYNVDFRNDNEGFAVGKSGMILRTETGGATWEKINAGIDTTFLRVDFTDDKNGWIVGYDGAILSSSDKGRTWTRQESKTTANLYGLYISKKYGWAVGANGVLVEYSRR